MVNAEVVATGSSGNFVVVQNKVAIDVGVSYKTVEPYMQDIRLVLLTHQHGDHFRASTVRRMALEKPRLVFGCGPFMAQLLDEAGVPKRQMVILRPNLLYDFGICNVIPVELEHDVPNYGYKLHFPAGKVFYATDTRSLRGVQARNYDLYLVEANFERDELQARMDAKVASGLYAYEQRVVRYHMSKEDCDDWLVRNAGPSSEFVYLHCHEVRNEGENS